MSSFKGLGLSDWLVAQMAAIGFKEPTPVQTNCIPPILEGENSQNVCHLPSEIIVVDWLRHVHVAGNAICMYSLIFFTVIIGKDCIGCAKTGSGKTAAFALPILHQLSKDPYGVFALVITPTRYSIVVI